MEDISNLPTKEENYWDIRDALLSQDSLEEIALRNRKLQAKFEEFRSQPWKLKKTLYLLVILGFIVFIFGEFMILFVAAFSDPGDQGEAILYPIIFGALPASLYVGYLKKLQKDLVNFSVAQRFKWLYDPGEHSDKWAYLKKIYPKIFDFGNQSQYVDNQFWGKVENNIDVWFAQFHYSIKHGKSSSTFHNTVFAFKLKEKVPCDFTLQPQNAFRKIGSFFSKKAITTEYNDFNKEFHIDYAGDRGLVGADIFETLSPDVMTRLYDYEKNNPDFKMTFANDVVVVSFSGELKYSHTNFLKSVEVDERDAAMIMQKIASSLTIARDLVPKIR